MLEKVSSFKPVFDSTSTILMLGTMPSPKSREVGFYYSHPQNRFWRIMAELFQTDVPASTDDKTRLMLENRIALWDVLAACMIKNAEDSSIKEAEYNNFSIIFSVADIRAVFTTGKKAFDLYSKHNASKTHPPIYLPSTSPANCRLPYAEIAESYRRILSFTNRYHS